MKSFVKRCVRFPGWVAGTILLTTCFGAFAFGQGISAPAPDAAKDKVVQAVETSSSPGSSDSRSDSGLVQTGCSSCGMGPGGGALCGPGAPGSGGCGTC